jgi:hypothetical protein
MKSGKNGRQARQILKQQRVAGLRQSRTQYKEKFPHSNGSLDTITGDKSYEIHERNIDAFLKRAQVHHRLVAAQEVDPQTIAEFNNSSDWKEIRELDAEVFNVSRNLLVDEILGEVRAPLKLDQMTISEVIDTLREAVADGMAQKTIEAYATAVNHVMVGGGFWKRSDAIHLKDHGLSNVGKRDVYKRETAKEWLKGHTREASRYATQIDVMRGFGLRYSEIWGDPYHDHSFTLKPSSFIYDSRRERIGVETIGKGGRYRLAWATSELNQVMISRYGAYARDFTGIAQMSVQDRTEAFVKRNRADQGAVVVKGMRREVPHHIFRADYARQMIDERNQIWSRRYAKNEFGTKETQYIGYTRLRNKTLNELRGQNIIIKIGDMSGHVEAFLETSQYLGHNRLDIMLYYIRKSN